MKNQGRKPGVPRISVPVLALVAIWATHSRCAQAGLIIENNLFYYTNSLNTGSESKVARTLGSFFAGGTIPKNYFIGWNVNFLSRTDTEAGASTTLSSTEMGPRFGMFLGRNENFSLAFTFNPLANASLTPAGGSLVKLQGTGYLFELGFAPQIGKHLFAGFKMVYDLVSYSTRTDVSGTTTNVSYSQTTLLPSIYLSWRF